jgi:hypothetical protein
MLCVLGLSQSPREKNRMLKPLVFAALTIATAHAQVLNRTGADPTFVRVEITELAQTNQYFSRSVIVLNQPLHIVAADFRSASPLALDQNQLANSLRAIDPTPEAITPLLRDPDPRIRTMALGALFQREDGRDLPLIATLASDSAQTLPDLHEAASSQPGPRPIGELESPQTVGDIARLMLQVYIGPPIGRSDGPLTTANAMTNFADYWKRYTGHNHAASWFAVKLDRATGYSFPVQANHRSAIQSALYEIDQLPSPDREWMLLYVLSPDAAGWNPELQHEEALIPDQDQMAVAAAKRLAPQTLLRFLARQRVTDDPDFDFSDRKNHHYNAIADLILLHADQLFRPQDVPAVLAQERVETSFLGQDGRKIVDPAWAIARARLQPARAIPILQDAIAAAHPGCCDDALVGQLAGAMWQIRGAAALPFLTNWFYLAPTPRPGVSKSTLTFLWQVKSAPRPETSQLIAALVKDSRFDQADLRELQELFKLANAIRPVPLISYQDLYGHNGAVGSLEQQRRLTELRKLLRQTYGTAT